MVVTESDRSLLARSRAWLRVASAVCTSRSLQDLVDLVGSEVVDLALCGAVSMFCRCVCLTDLPDPSAGLLMMLVGRALAALFRPPHSSGSMLVADRLI